jgi:hypothetical protein
MKKILNITFGFVLLTMAIAFIGCESDSIDDGSDYLADNPYESLDHIELTGETAYDLQIIPDTMTLPRGESFQLYVTGGVEPYGSWINTVPDLGYVSKSGLYTAGKHYSGTNTVSITDASGETVSMTVIVQ